MAPRKYATWPIFSISARRLSAACQQFSTLRLRLRFSALQLVILSPFEHERVREAGGYAEVYLSVIPARGGIHCGTRSAPDHPGTVLVPAFTSVLFAAEGVDHQLEVLWAAGDPDGLLVVNPILAAWFRRRTLDLRR